MATYPAMPNESQWKNAQFLQGWKQKRKRRLEEKWKKQYSPLFDDTPDVSNSSHHGAAAYIDWDLVNGETLTERAQRLEGKENRGRNRSRRSAYSVQNAIGKDDAGNFVIAPWAQRATPVSQECAKFLYEIGLDRKAQRRIACAVLWAVRPCPNDHRWRVGYQCGNRYCQYCGPKRTNRVLADASSKLAPIVADIRSRNRSAVVAAIDFTWINTGRMPDGDEIREFNRCIKKCFRILERKLGFDRKAYGFMWCNEFGGNNTNLHAHGIYVGPWIPQTKRKKELSRVWERVTKGRGRFVSIQLKPFAEAIAHALKYPAKFVEKSSPARLAELENAFHRVRRLHSLARFYKAKMQEPANQLDFCSCPICHAPLSEIVEWQPLDQVKDVPDLEEFVRRHAVTGAGPPVP